tara:strand:+ start:1576 stop:4494 length:2919 start_codon:yes stop_codon:yes gene_type:complete
MRFIGVLGLVLSICHTAMADAELMWRHSNSGENWLYTVQGELFTPYRLGQLDGQWISYRADFSADGEQDVLWRNVQSGENWLHRIENQRISEVKKVNQVGLDWRIVGVADLNADGTADILWRNASNGMLWSYLMQGHAILKSQPVANVSDNNWRILCLADVNGDGSSDIIWRHEVTHDVYVYLMHEGRKLAGKYLAKVGREWSLAASGDFNGDGSDDLLWRNLVTGVNWVYQMQDGSIAKSYWLNRVVDPGWQVAAVNDFNGDGADDLLWRHQTSGDNVQYWLNGQGIERIAFMNQVALDWYLVDSRIPADNAAPLVKLTSHLLVGEDQHQLRGEVYDQSGVSQLTIDGVKANVVNGKWQLVVDAPNELLEFSYTTSDMASNSDSGMINSHGAKLMAWTHQELTPNMTSGVVDGQIRSSAHYQLAVGLAQNPEFLIPSAVYTSIPRSGLGKRGYTEIDGAEFAANHGVSMSWSSFLYADDAWLVIEPTDGHIIKHVDEVSIRPKNLVLDKALLPDNRIALRIPYTGKPLQFSVEFSHQLYTSYMDANTQHVSDRPDGDAREIHTEPRHALMVFANPLEGALDREVRPDPASNGQIFYPEPGEIDLNGVTESTIYFRPGSYYMPWNRHADLNPAVRWIYLAPGAYIKGALQFPLSDDINEYKVTGYGVLSGENYIYEADLREGYQHLSQNGNCHADCVKMLRFASAEHAQSLFIRGVTIANPSYHSFVIYSQDESLVTMNMDVANYKQTGAWYWQTDGMELYQGGVLKDSFFHANDDVLKAYHSQALFEDIVIWKAENGPVIQFGWSPREIEDTTIRNIRIIHNRQHWDNSVRNQCIINSAKHWDHDNDNIADPNKWIRRLLMENIVAEGRNLCAMRLFAQSNFEHVHIKGLHIDSWNALDHHYHESHFKALWNADFSKRVIIDSGVASNEALQIEDYRISGQAITRFDDSWRAENSGALNFDGELWDYWFAW